MSSKLKIQLRYQTTEENKQILLGTFADPAVKHVSVGDYIECRPSLNRAFHSVGKVHEVLHSSLVPNRTYLKIMRFCHPEETKFGRQHFHGRYEIFKSPKKTASLELVELSEVRAIVKVHFCGDARVKSCTTMQNQDSNLMKYYYCSHIYHRRKNTYAPVKHHYYQNNLCHVCRHLFQQEEDEGEEILRCCSRKYCPTCTSVIRASKSIFHEHPIPETLCIACQGECHCEECSKPVSDLANKLSCQSCRVVCNLTHLTVQCHVCEGRYHRRCVPSYFARNPQNLVGKRICFNQQTEGFILSFAKNKYEIELCPSKIKKWRRAETIEKDERYSLLPDVSLCLECMRPIVDSSRNRKCEECTGAYHMECFNNIEEKKMCARCLNVRWKDNSGNSSNDDEIEEDDLDLDKKNEELLLDLQQQLNIIMNSENMDATALASILRKFHRQHISIPFLKKSGLGKLMTRLKKKCKEVECLSKICLMAKILIKKWKDNISPCPVAKKIKRKRKQPSFYTIGEKSNHQKCSSSNGKKKEKGFPNCFPKENCKATFRPSPPRSKGYDNFVCKKCAEEQEEVQLRKLEEIWFPSEIKWRENFVSRQWQYLNENWQFVLVGFDGVIASCNNHNNNKNSHIFHQLLTNLNEETSSVFQLPSSFLSQKLQKEESCARLLPRRQIEKLKNKPIVRLMNEDVKEELVGEEDFFFQQQEKRAQRLGQRRFNKDVGSADLRMNQLHSSQKKLRFGKSKIHDWGVFAEEPIEKNEMILEYKGELIRNAVADRREKLYEKLAIGSDYMFRIDMGHVIDATYKGALARFLNHSCDPNCFTRIITHNNQKKILIYAKTKIAQGEELKYDYKFPLDFENRIPCHCQADSCRKFLN